MKCYIIFCAFFLFIFVFNVHGTPEDLTYYFKSRHNHVGIPVKNHEIHNVGFIKQVFNTHKKTIIIIHGWKDNHDSSFNTEISEAIFETSDVNVIVVDWSVQAAKTYVRAKNAVPNVGHYCASFLKELVEEFDYPLDYIKVVGFSLGAHVSGIVGKHFHGELPSIVGLDPARPLIDLNDNDFALNNHDAKHVQIIHTDGGSSGVMIPIGDSDFYPNGGYDQHGCNVNGCSHNRAWVYYAESIRNNHFVAQHCHNYDEYVAHDCMGDHALMGGLDIDVSAKGSYYLTTNADSPYGRG